MKRKAWLFALMVFVVVCFCSIAIADEQGVCGENAWWYLEDNGKLTIAGTGAIMDFDEDPTNEWHGFSRKITSVEVCEGITSLGDFAFAYCPNIKRIILPQSLTKIGSAAFGNTAISSIDLPMNVDFIGDSAFDFCRNLESISIPDKVKELSEYTFANCYSLKIIDWPSSLEKIDRGVFESCYGLKEMVIPNSVISIDRFAFVGCKNLESIVLPKGLLSLGDEAFARCVKLSNILIPGSCKVGAAPFVGCVNLSDIQIDSSNKYCKIVDGILYSGDMKTLIQYPAGKSSTSFTVPKQVAIIGKYAFSSNNILTDIEVLEGVVKIEDGAFRSCSRLKSISIPFSLHSIGSYAIANNPALRQIYYNGLITDRDLMYIDTTNLSLENVAWHYKNEPSSEKQKVKVSYILPAEKVTIGKPITLSYEIKGGSGRYENISYLVEQITENICLKYQSDELQASSGTITIIPECGDYISICIRCTDKGTGVYWGDNYSDLMICYPNPDIPVNITIDPNPIVVYKESKINYSYMGKQPMDSSLLQLWSFENDDKYPENIMMSWPEEKNGSRDINFHNITSFFATFYGKDKDGNCFYAKSELFNVVEKDESSEQEQIDCDPVIIEKLKLADINGDSVVDGRDAIHLMKYLADDLEDEEMKAMEASGVADVNQDSEINEIDLLYLMRYLGGEFDRVL